MKTFLSLALALFILGCSKPDLAHTDSSIVGCWDGLVRFDCSVCVDAQSGGYLLTFSDSDNIYHMNVISVLGDTITLPLGFYEPYPLTGYFFHPTPSTIYFDCTDSAGNEIEIGFSNAI